LENEARTRRVTKSRLVRESLEKTLRKQKPRGATSCYDLARDLAGTLKGLPEDLAGNPEYIHGFGQLPDVVLKLPHLHAKPGIK
jgi:hypothetical protein